MSASRRKARRLLLQALYQMQLAGHSAEDLQQQFAADSEAEGADLDYFSSLLGFIGDNTAALDINIADYGEIAAARLDPVEHAILWTAIAELREQADVPSKVVINEAIELAKAFGAEGGYKYINGVLDKAAADLRAV
ncbi:MAG: transcription antitermination factor NusB [Gammaproteobacteria bacterium]